MIKDKKGLYFLIDESIERDLRNEDEKLQRIKCYLKKDHSGGYVLVDTDIGKNNFSIKCIFSEESLKEYLAGLPSYMDYNSFEHCQILLKNYRFDYLILENDQNSLIYKLVCYIDNFEIDATNKSLTDIIPKNINLDHVIKNKIETVVNNFLKKSHKNLEFDSEKDIFIFNANNFIHRSFSSVEGDKRYNSQLKAFDILRKLKKIEGNNLLLKTEISLGDPYSYLQELEEDIFIHNKIKNFDFTPVFSKWPTQLDKVKGEELKASQVDISAAKQEIVVRPSDLNFEVDLSEESIKDFLLRKVKRQRPVRDFEKLPENIQNLVINYGDVCANINNKTFENYLFYRKYIEFGRKVDRMDEN